MQKSRIIFITLSLLFFYCDLMPGKAQMSPGYQPEQMQNNNAYSMNPIANPSNSAYASIERPKLSDFLKTLSGLNNNQFNINVIAAGTVFTGVLQEDVSSKTSKAGDIFSIMLPENYMVNNKILIPQYSKFVGTVVSAAPAATMHYGNPGNLQVSIQTLVTPDGISIPINGFIDYNPSQQTKTDLKKSRGVPLGEWGKSAMYSLHYAAEGVGSKLGLPIFYKGQTGAGVEFCVTRGELLPVRLSEPLDVTPIMNSRQAIMPSFAPPFAAPIPNPTNVPIPANTSVPNNTMMPNITTPAGPEPF